jgi:ATP adenylyltransferase
VIHGATTAISRTKPSKPTRILLERGFIQPGWRVLDYGCGSDPAADVYGWERYDPEYAPWPPSGPYDAIVCHYVLNVLPAADESKVLDAIESLLTDGGVAYITVRRDLPETGRQGRGIWQRYVTLDLPSVYRDSGCEIYMMTKRRRG